MKLHIKSTLSLPRYIFQQKDGLFKLTVNRLKDEDTGHYTCTVRNEKGSKISSACYLQVERE